MAGNMIKNFLRRINSIDLFFLATILLSFSSCALMEKLTGVQPEMMHSKNRYEQKVKELEKDNRDLSDEIRRLKVKYRYEKKINRQLVHSIEILRNSMGKKDTVIRLQRDIIALLDDAKKTISSSLYEDVNIDNKTGNCRTLKPVVIERVSFAPGSCTLSDKGKAVLLKIAAFLKDMDGADIIVAGHTDNLPVVGRLRHKFSNNWELSCARAVAVVDFLQSRCGIDPKRLSVHAYSSYRPVASNSTEEGRRKNRRIEIISEGNRWLGSSPAP